AHQVRQIRTEAPICRSAADRVTVDTCSCFENAPAGGYLFILRRRLLLRSDPRVKIFGAVYGHPQKHLGVLRPAILRALAEKDSGASRIHPHTVRVVRNQVGLTAKLRNPEAVVRIGGKQLQECGPGMCGITHGNVQLVCGDDPEAWIPILPPELMPNDGDVYSTRRLWSILDRVNHLGGSDEQHHHDQNRNNSPGQLNLCASVYLCRFAAVIRRSAAEFHDGVHQQTADDDEYDCRDGKHKHGQIKDRPGWRGLWSEDVRETR